MFNNLPQDILKLKKSNGEIIDDIKAIISKETIVIDSADLPIEEGDILIRILPNKLEEKYEILDYTFYQKMFDIPAHYQIEYQRYTEKNSNKKIENHTTKTEIYNIDSSTVIINSKNSSININKNEVVFIDLLEKANQLNVPHKDEIIQSIENMRDNVNTPLFNEKYKEFMSVAADTMTVFSPYLVALASFL